MILSGRLRSFAYVVAFFAIGLLGGLLGYWASDRDMPVTVAGMEAATPEVAPGNIFRARYQFIRHRSCDTHVERLLFDGHGQRFVLSDLDFAAGTLPLGKDSVFVPAMVPPQALPSAEAATYRTLNCYACNPVHLVWPVCDFPRDIRFRIIPIADRVGSR
jgi:hypothetical protein